MLPSYHIYANIFDLRHLPLALNPTSIAAYAARPKFIHQKDLVGFLQQFSYSNTFCWSIPFHVVTIAIFSPVSIAYHSILRCNKDLLKFVQHPVFASIVICVIVKTKFPELLVFVYWIGETVVRKLCLTEVLKFLHIYLVN